MRSERILFVLTCLVLPSAAASASAATLCVGSSGTPGCYTHISDAVSAASPGDVIKVAPGTYAESVVITKPLSLVGENATIDATGRSQGIFVDGSNTPNLSLVHISGFKVQNANFEGILVLNASSVTVSSNTVTGNNKGLQAGACPGLPIFEPGEQSDCGEGVHFQAVDHSILTNNTIQGNSGGVLLSDDTGATHDNLVSNNIVSDNAYACGITMASHVVSPTVVAAGPFGVYHNTVYGNRSQRNGLAIGGGAGIGIFASVPFTKAYGNVVVNNLVSDNGLPGITMHAHAPFQSLNDNMVVGNTITNNGRDTEDAATAGPTGINIYSLTPVTGNIFSGNSIQNEMFDVVVKVPALVQVQFNAILGTGIGLDNLGVGPVDATNNWWSCPAGPNMPGGCSSAVGANVLSTPYLQQPIPSAPNF